MNFSAGYANLLQIIVKSLRGGHCIILTRKLQEDTNNLIERAFLHISVVQRKIENNVAVYEFFGWMDAHLHEIIVKSLRGRAMHCSD